MKFTIALLAGFLMIGSAFAQQKEQRVALVIGNASYKSSPLKNPVNDANDMATTLKGLGYRLMDSGSIPSQEGTRRAYVLKMIGDVLVSAELERRIIELENQQPRPGSGRRARQAQHTVFV